MSKVEEFIAQLTKLVEQDDRAALARLRHSLAFEPGEYVHAFPLIERFTVGLPGERRKLYYLVAGLFASHPENNPDPRENLGRTLKRLYVAQDESPSVEKRFLALLEADDGQLPEHLRHLVNLLKSKGLAVNWEQLLRDLIQRQYDPERVKKEWAQGFYRPINGEAAETPDNSQEAVRAE